MKPGVSDEMLDVIDDADIVVGNASRREIHAKCMSHRAVHIFLFNSSGRIYVQRRSASKDSHPLKLDSSAAGHLDSGEDYHHAAVRELFEELSITAPLNEELRFGPGPMTDNERVALYTCYTDSSPKPDPEEIISGKFWIPDELTAAMHSSPQDFVPAFVTLWNMYHGRGKCDL